MLGQGHGNRPLNRSRGVNKGIAVGNLGRYQVAIECHDRARKSTRSSKFCVGQQGKCPAQSWLIRGRDGCFGNALKESTERHKLVWVNKGIAWLDALPIRGRGHMLRQRLGDRHKKTSAWVSKGVILHSLGRHDGAIDCYDRALDIDTRNTFAWIDKGVALQSLCRHDRCNRLLRQSPGYRPYVEVRVTQQRQRTP